MTTTFKPLKQSRLQFNPIKSLTPDSLSRILDGFHAGNLRSAALLWDAIERRDDVLQGVASKRKKAVSRLDWRIHTLDDSEEALQQKKILEHFYNTLTTTHACDPHECGGLSLLIKQMMDAVGKRYAAHEIVYDTHAGKTTATFRFVPLWFFHRRDGQLRFVPDDSNYEGVALKKDAWLITTGDGLMESCSIAYLFKHLPLRDWLIYCERNGMPGVRGVTDAPPNSLQWEMAKEAVRDFGAEFHALMSSGTTIEAIDLSSKGELPYGALVERMDRAMTALWRGSDLSTLTRTDAVGASLQGSEMALLEEDDAHRISEALNIQVDRVLLYHHFGVERGKAYFKLHPQNRTNKLEEIEIVERLKSLGVDIDVKGLMERLGE